MTELSGVVPCGQPWEPGEAIKPLAGRPDGWRNARGSRHADISLAVEPVFPNRIDPGADERLIADILPMERAEPQGHVGAKRTAPPIPHPAPPLSGRPTQPRSSSAPLRQC